MKPTDGFAQLWYAAPAEDRSLCLTGIRIAQRTLKAISLDHVQKRR